MTDTLHTYVYMTAQLFFMRTWTPIKCYHYVRKNIFLLRIKAAYYVYHSTKYTQLKINSIKCVQNTEITLCHHIFTMNVIIYQRHMSYSLGSTLSYISCSV